MRKYIGKEEVFLICDRGGRIHSKIQQSVAFKQH